MKSQDNHKKKLYFTSLNYKTNIKLIIYAKGYISAAYNLIDSILIKEDSYVNNELIFPILYLYRHYIELMFKQIIAEYKLYKKEEIKIPEGHKLCILWDNYVKSISIEIANNKIITNNEVINLNVDRINDKDIELIENIISELNDFDNNSITFRYPITKDGENTINKDFDIELKSLKETISNVYYILDHKISSYLYSINNNIYLK